MSAIWMLGASDPEMRVLASLLRDTRARYAYALRSGNRVRAHEAYDADAPDAQQGVRIVYRVECSWQPDCAAEQAQALGVERVVVVDHHRPGDPGYGIEPRHFLVASSLGQAWLKLAESGSLGWRATSPDHVYAALHMRGDEWVLHIVAKRGVLYSSEHDLDAQVRGKTLARQQVSLVLPREHVLAAASDHCLAAAYRGECPGVDPEELMRWRTATRAEHQGRTQSDLLADIERARAALRSAPALQIAGHDVADLTTCAVIPELPEAAAREGRPFLARLYGCGRDRIVLQAAPAAVIEAWLAEQRALKRTVYGDPARGFAGAYLQDG